MTTETEALILDGEHIGLSRIEQQWSACVCTDSEHVMPSWWHADIGSARYQAGLAVTTAPHVHIVRRVVATTRTEIQS